MAESRAPRTDQLVASDVERVAVWVEQHVDTTVEWPGGRVGEIELALIDAVFSMNAKYGNSPDSGVRKWVTAYAEAVGRPCDDLRRLIGHENLLYAQTRQKVPGGDTKAGAITKAARNLVDAGFVSSEDVVRAYPDRIKKVKSAYVGVEGLSHVTFDYFLMLLGVPGIKADRHIVAFVSSALNGRPVSSYEARALLLRVAEDRGVPAQELDHQVWRYQRDL